MKEIQLNKGQIAIVDDADYDWLNQWKWFAYRQQDRPIYYARRMQTVDGRRVLISMHRLILGLERGDKREGEHVNRTTLDNRRSNLRIATHAQNQCNKVTTSATGYKGVYYYPKVNKWGAQIRMRPRSIWLGYYSSVIEAHLAYSYAAAHYFGEFARAK